METITVSHQSENDQAWVFSVAVGSQPDTTAHTVTLPKTYWQTLTSGHLPPEELVQKSFRFLLEREPKESILSSFDLLLIQQYFPEYEQAISARLTPPSS